MPHPTSLVREIIRTFLPDYLRLVEPDSADHLALDRLVFPDPLPGWSALPDRTVEERTGLSIVGEAPTRWGEKATLLIHVEAEALTPAELSRRIGRSFMDLEVHYCQPVLLNVVYLRGGRPGINLETASVCRLLGMDLLRIYFSAFGLEGCRAEYFLERPEPVAWALSTLMRPARLTRQQHRETCRRRIAAAPLPAERKALLRQAVEDFLG